MRVLISGGGIAGLTLAYWLNRYRIPALVIEQAGNIRQEGYGLDFYGTGYDVAERMGILDTLREQQIQVESIPYVDARGKHITALDTKLMQKVLHGKYLALMHGTLEDALYQAVANDVEIRYNSTITAVKNEAEGMIVTFNDGTSEIFDILVGADGIHSRTRRLAFGPDERFQQYLGCYFACYPLPDRYGIGHFRKNYVEPGRTAIAYNTNHEGEIVAFFMYKTPDVGFIPHEQRLPLLRKAFAGMGWVTQNLLEDAPASEAIFMDTVSQIQMPTWHQGRVVLVGDACGCPTALSGQGASMAVGGAYILAEALHEERDYTAAFQRYEQAVKPHVEQRQKNARTTIKTFIPKSQTRLVTQRLFMKLLLREAFSGILLRQFGAQSILPEPHSV